MEIPAPRSIAWTSRATTTWLAWALLLVVAAAAEAMTVINGGAWSAANLFQSDVGLLFVLTYGAAGALILRRQPGHPMGRLLFGLTAVMVVAQFSSEYAVLAYVTTRSALPLRLAMAWLSQWTLLTALPVGVTLVFLAFPDGFSSKRRWRVVLGVAIAGAALLTLSFLLKRGPISPHDRGDYSFVLPVANPTGVLGLVPGAPMEALGWLLTAIGLILADIAILSRLLRSTGEARQQLRWMAYFAAPVAPAFVAHFVLQVSGAQGFDWPALIYLVVAQVGVPVATGIAILRYRLYSLDVIVSRALLYALLSGFVAAAYIGATAGLSHALSAQAPLTPVLGTIVAAMLVLAVRQPVQQAVTRLIYGRRREPMALLQTVSERMQRATTHDELLAVVAAEVRSALKLERVEVVNGAGERLAGDETDDPSASVLPLVHQGERVGELRLVAARGDRLRPNDLRILESLRPQLAALIQAAALERDLVRSRERLAAALEEERRRLRRDLHDGLGPMLTAAALRADAAKNLVQERPERAERLLLEIRREMTTAVEEVRRLVYGLRPPALDDIGLVGAIKQQAESLGASPQSGRLRVVVDAPDKLPPLPAAVEVAAYRIAAEGMTNVARHAGASTCHIRLRIGADVQIEIVDDGRGWSGDLRPGVGLTSMRERAAALGGSVSLRRQQRGGVHVSARLPLTLDTAA